MFSDFAEAITEPGLRALAIAQHAWLSVDAMHVHTTEADAYRLIGAVLAKLAPPDAAVLVHPSKPIVDALRRRRPQPAGEWIATNLA